MRAQDVLPDAENEVQINGTPVRKGTVGAFLANVRAFSDPDSTPDVRHAALQDIEAALPALQVLGLFKVLEIRDARLRTIVTTKLAAMTTGEA